MSEAWQRYVERTKLHPDATVLAEGDGWLAWVEGSLERGLIRHCDVLNVHGDRIKGLDIAAELDIAESAELLSIVGSYQGAERERALAAIQALEGGNA